MRTGKHLASAAKTAKPKPTTEQIKEAERTERRAKAEIARLEFAANVARAFKAAGYKDAKPKVNVLTAKLWAEPFDPTGAPEHTPARTLAEAPLGGLGLPLIRRCSDWMSYRREGGRNRFMFGARWPKL